MRESLKDLLSLEAIECDATDTGKKGLAMFQLNQPQAVVLDLQLPDLSGFQICQEIKRQAHLRHIPVVMMTGRFTEPQDQVQGSELGADSYFTKPFDPALFVAHLKLIRPAN